MAGRGERERDRVKGVLYGKVNEKMERKLEGKGVLRLFFDVLLGLFIFVYFICVIGGK